MTQQQIADMLGINRVTITGYELGRRTPDVFTLKKMADILDVSVDYLLSESI